MTNAIRGTKYFDDGQWQAWRDKDMEVVIDLEDEQLVKKVSVGTLEYQNYVIYFPKAVEVLTSIDGKSFKKQGDIKRAYSQNSDVSLKDFVVNINPTKARFVKVKVTNIGMPPNKGGSWVFVDEITVE